MSLSGWGSSGIGRQHTILDRFFEAPLPRKPAPPETSDRVEILDKVEIATLITKSPVPETPPIEAR
jgi:hypothetical protein